MYFISDKNFHGEIVFPRVPKSIASYEDDKVRRICVSDTIKGCLNATLDTVCSHNDFIFVHTCEAEIVVTPTDIQVKDSKVTKEKWILEPVLMELYDRFFIKIIFMPSKNRLQYNFYGENTNERIIIYTTNMFEYYGRGYCPELYDRVIWNE